MAELVDTDFTPTVHTTEYPSLSPARPELSQANRVVLISGGGTNIGKSIAEHFVLASAATVIIVGRRVDVLEAAAAELTQKAQAAKSPSVVIARRCDVATRKEVDALWEELAKLNLLVDVIVLNAAKFTEAEPLVELGVDEIWSQVETNFYGPLVMTERFMKQNQGRKKFIVNVTSAVIHSQRHPMVIPRAAYVLSKTSATLFVQLLSYQHQVDEVQVVTFHPGLIFGDGFVKMGVTKDMLPFDEVELPGAFAVWAASSEAKFANGRVLWASWDVDELASGQTRKLIEEDDDFLRVSVVGFKGSKRALAYV